MMNFLKNYFLLISMLVGSLVVIVMATRVPIVPQNDAVSVPAPIAGKVVQDYNLPQSLPKDAVTITKADGSSVSIEAEIAKTPKETGIGMMFRDTVPEKTGMLFLFSEIEEHSFWMKNTFVSLDILFINSDKKISHIHKMAKPMSFDAIPSGGEISAVLEIGGGQADALGISIGDTVENKLLTTYVANGLQIKARESKMEEVFPDE